MSTGKKGLGARLLKAVRASTTLEIDGVKLVINQMNAETHLFFARGAQEMLKEGADEEGEIDISKFDPGLLFTVVLECTFDDEGNRAFGSLEEVKALPFGPVAKIVNAAIGLMQSGEDDGDTQDADTKAGSTEREPS